MSELPGMREEADYLGGKDAEDGYGRPVAVPLTQDPREERAQRIYDDALDRTEQALRRLGWSYEPAINQYAARIVDAVLSASPEVLAAAMGGTVHVFTRRDGWGDPIETRVEIVLPPREVSRGE
ncbi:MAG: hypothetical protein J2P24_00225 [Streptosporangiales bacterium]|nr:hypothetical protein [Streptosporangiales bacterium]